MLVNGVSRQNDMQPGVLRAGAQATDEVSRNIQKQISDTQEQLQSLSSKEDMPMEEKQKKRQELQKKISDLNNQLKQREIELRKEKQQKGENSVDESMGIGAGGKESEQVDKINPSKEDDKQNQGMSLGRMRAMISAEAGMERADAQGNVKAGLERVASVLRSEINTDAQRGSDVAQKQNELEKVENRIQKASSAQFDILGETNKTMQKAAKEELDSSDSKNDTLKDSSSQNTTIKIRDTETKFDYII